MIQDFDIRPISDEEILRAQAYIDTIAKPLGSMGQLERLAARLAALQDTLRPSLSPREHFVFAADHGIEREGVSKSPREVTRQVVYSMLRGGAGICFLTRQHDFRLHIVDVGVDHEFGDEPDLVHRKIRRGTRSFLTEAAMTPEEAHRALSVGIASVDEAHQRGAKLLSFGEMGIANTSASDLWMYSLTDFHLEECIGRGSGLDDEGVTHKLHILRQAVKNYTGPSDPFSILVHFGGYELVSAVGAMLRSAELGIAFLVDGFIMPAFWWLVRFILRWRVTLSSGRRATKRGVLAYFVIWVPNQSCAWASVLVKVRALYVPFPSSTLRYECSTRWLRSRPQESRITFRPKRDSSTNFL